MKRYLGSVITAFGAVLSPLFVIAPIAFSIVVLCSEVSAATVFLTGMLIVCSFIWGKLIWNYRYQLYSWGTFKQDSVEVTILPHKKITLPYENCRACGIGYYRHSFLNSNNSLFGSKICFIFLSSDPFEEAFRTQINKWAPSDTRIKLQFSKALYDYLIVCLPQKQSKMLERDYRHYYISSKQLEE